MMILPPVSSKIPIEFPVYRAGLGKVRMFPAILIPLDTTKRDAAALGMQENIKIVISPRISLFILLQYPVRVVRHETVRVIANRAYYRSRRLPGICLSTRGRDCQSDTTRSVN